MYFKLKRVIFFADKVFYLSLLFVFYILYIIFEFTNILTTIMEKLYKLSISNISDENPFFIRNFILADSSQKPEHISFNHPFTFDGIIFGICLKGSSRIKINFKEYEITKNSIFTILPNQILEPVDRTDDFFVEYCCFHLISSVAWLCQKPLM